MYQIFSAVETDHLVFWLCQNCEFTALRDVNCFVYLANIPAWNCRYLYLAELENQFEEDELLLAESGVKSEDGDNERNERKSLLEAFIILFGNLQEERYQNLS